MTDDDRPDPDRLLKAIQREEKMSHGGQLRVFFGMAAGVGKTFAMLTAAHQKKLDGVDVVIGTVDTHGRKETATLTENLELIPRKQVEYKGTMLQEMDVDAVLMRKPKLVLVDELAHTNVPNSRHHKRWQDVFELLDAGIDVYTTLNVQHLESRKEAVEQISGITIRETVPDSILERAAQIDLIDLSPTDLLRRLRDGKVYLGERADVAQRNFFQEGPLTALREIALRITAEKVDRDLQDFMVGQQIQGPWKTTERLMVAVSHSPFSERLIRATRRIAYNLEAPWIALHINTGFKLNEADSAQLAKNLSMVRELGGELVTTTELDVPSAIQRIARQKNVTQLILGRPTRRWFKDVIEGGSLLDRLVRDSGDFDVHIIRQESRRSLKPSWWTGFNTHAQFSHYWNVAWALAFVSLISGSLHPWIGYRAVGFLFLLAVLVISLFASMGPILFAAIGSDLIWNYFFIPPRLTFAISEKEDVIMCAMYVLAAVTTGLLTNRIRGRERLLREREARTTLLYEIVSDIVRADNSGEFIQSITDRVERLMGGLCSVFLRKKKGVLDPEIIRSQSIPMDEKELAVATWALNSGKPAGWSTDTLSEAASLYLPLIGKEGTIGVLAFRPENRKETAVDAENMLPTVAKQLAISIERELFEIGARANDRLQESEQLHQTLLNSVSHELRTPLTALIGAATAIAEDVVPQSNSRGKELACELLTACERLNMVVENLLDMTRLNSGVLQLNKEWQDTNDLISAAQKKLQRYNNKHPIVKNIEEKHLFVEMDFRLMEHAIFNILHNAITYSSGASPIVVTACVDGKIYRISVEDEGPGVPPEDLKRIFDKFYRAPGTPTGGTGLGLAIAKSIVELHGGAIAAENRSPHGLRITIRLPYREPPELKV